MRSNVAQYDLIAPTTLDAVLQTLAENPGHYTPIAGGTELMVALGAGRLTQKNLLSINHLNELRFINVTPDAITIGSGTTFTDIRKHPIIASDFSLLTQAASWTGSIANQNRGTLGGNIVNASPAADSPPALLAYDADLTLISARGTRTMPYADFHLGYKKTALAPDELLHSITLPRHFAGYITYIRKVGTRNAQAISKVAIAAFAPHEQRHHRRHPHRRRQPPRTPHPPHRHRASPPQPTHHPRQPSPPPAPPSPPKPSPSTTSAAPPNTAPP